MFADLTLLVFTFLIVRGATGRPLAKRDYFLPVPHNDSFYDAPDNLNTLKPGEVYNTRTVYPKVAYPDAATVAQVAFRTTDTFGNYSHTLATVFTPRNPDGNTKLFSYQVWEDSVEIDCSPSYSLYGGLLTPDGITATLDTAIFINWALGKGIYVVVPDQEGPLSTALAGFNEGYAGVDGIRAAEAHLGFANDIPVALYGYSGGAHATLWMTDLVGEYAPELNIIGAALGGTPVDVRGLMKFLDDGLFSGFMVAALGGLLKAYPDAAAEVWPQLLPEYQNDIKTAWAPDTCIVNEVLVYGLKDYENMTTGTNLLEMPALADVFSNESLLKNVSSHSVSTPKFPRYFFHAAQDEIVPDNLVRQYISQQCADGANIQYVQWPGGEHLSTEYLGIPNAIQFLQQLYEGETPSVPCGTPAQDIITITTEGVGSIIGEGVLAAIKALDGVLTPLGRINLHP